MKKMYPILGILLATLFVAEILSFRGFPPSIEPQLPTMTTINSVTVLPYTPTQNQTETSTPTVSVKEHILEQIRQLAAEYDQAVQAEKQHGIVEYSQDPTTGEDIFLFLGDSFISISNLNIEFHTKMNDLINLYTQIYRDETNPTPFPTPVLEEQRQPYLDFLYEQTKSYCSNQDMNAQNATVIFYDPGDGKYHPLLIDEALARCYLYGWMIEEWRTAPQLARLDKAVDMTLIRQTTGNPGLTLTFQSVSEVPNAPWRSAALYRDETGTSYYVDIDTARLSAIEPSLLGEPNITSAEKKNIDELRGIARQFAFINSPRLTELESVLLYEENCKDEICFFRWDYRNRNWSGTDWAMMAPFLQVGVLTDGKIIAYNNTLDLFQ